MKTVPWIQWLFEHGWTVRMKAVGPFKWEWRSPKGVSGDDYTSPDFETLPPAVEQHILRNAVLSPTRDLATEQAVTCRYCCAVLNFSARQLNTGLCHYCAHKLYAGCKPAPNP